jgi:hypothetical protein
MPEGTNKCFLNGAAHNLKMSFWTIDFLNAKLDFINLHIRWRKKGHD